MDSIINDKSRLVMRTNIQMLISRILGYIIIGSAGINYATRLWGEPSEKVILVGLSAFATIGALSALCFTYASCLPSEEVRKTPVFAGEEFLRATLFLLQAIFFRYIGDAILQTQFIAWLLWLKYGLGYTISVLSSIVAVMSTWATLHGFDAINDFLWERYLHRTRLMRTKTNRK